MLVIKFERARGEDMLAVADLYRAYFSEMEIPASEWPNFQALSDAAELSRLIFLLARVQEEPVGFCSTTTYPTTYKNQKAASLFEVYVKPTHRKKGIAKGLFTEMRRLLKDLGCSSLNLTCEQKDLPLCHKFGFNTTGQFMTLDL